MRFRILGQLEVFDGTGWLGVTGAVARSVVATLLLHANEVASFDRIVDDMWGATPPKTAVTQVHRAVMRLRRTMPDSDGARLATTNRGYRLTVEDGDVDTHRFAHLADLGHEAARSGRPDRAAELFGAALSVWRGPALADVPPSPLVVAEVNRLTERRLAVWEARADAELTCGRHAQLVGDLRGHVEEHPLREQGWRLLMIALDGSGRRAEALSAYAEVRALLARELGVEPGPELQRTRHAILTADQKAATPGPLPNQLPLDLTTFVDRAELLETAQRWLASEEPWLAITGPGGVGKTAAAIRLAHRCRHLFPDGQFYARLAGSTTVGSALVRFLATLGVPENRDMPAEPEERAAMFWELLAGYRVLVVLDDVPDEAQVRPLLPTAAGCGLVVTSRRRLAGLDSMRGLPLAALPAEHGVTLLRTVAGTSRVAPDDSLAPAVVSSCGGLPLAIRIAGARLAARPNWTTADLARQLADAGNRLDWLQLGDRGVRASLITGHSGLSAEGRRLLRRLAVLDQPDFAPWVAAALLNRAAGHAERLLDDLVEAHLVEPAGRGRTGPRYTMHDLVRLAARETARRTDKAAVERVLSGWLALASAADDRLAHWVGLDPQPATVWQPPPEVLAACTDPMGWFDEERHALRHAIHQAAREGYAGMAWGLAQRVSNYLELRGCYEEWRDVLVHGLRSADAAADRQGQATMLGLLMQVEANRDEYLSSIRYGALTVAAYREVPAGPASRPAPPVTTPALAQAREKGDDLAIGFEASRLALASRLAGADCDYLSLFEEARDAFRAGGVPLLELWTIKYIGLVYCRRNRCDEAEQLLLRAQAIAKDLGDEALTAYGGGDLAGVATAHGRPDLAERLATEAVRQAREMDDRWSEARALTTLGDIHTGRADSQTATAAYREALDIWRALRHPHRIRYVRSALTHLGEAH